MKGITINIQQLVGTIVVCGNELSDVQKMQIKNEVATVLNDAIKDALSPFEENELSSEGNNPQQ